MSLSKGRFNHTSLIGIAALLISLGIMAGVYFERRQVMIAYDTDRAALETIREKLGGRPDLNGEYLRLDNEIKRLVGFIPTLAGQAEFVKELQDLADNCNITIKSCHAKAETGVLPNLPGYTVYKWDLTMSSGYRQLIAFIQTLAGASRFVKIANLEVRNSGGDLNAMNIVMTLDLISKTIPEKVK